MRNHIKLALKWGIVFLLPAMLLLIPLTDVFTIQIRTFLMLTLWAILVFMFEIMNTTAAALLLTFGYGLFGVVPLTTALSPWTNTVLWMIFASLVLVHVVEDTSLLKRLAYYLIIKTGGTYFGILFGLAGLCIISAILIPSIFTSFAVMTLAYGICLALGLQKGKATAGIMLVSGVVFAEATHFLYIPQGVGVSLSVINQVMDLPSSYLMIVKHTIVFVPMVFLVTFLIGKMMKPEVPINGIAYFKQELTALGPMSQNDKKTLSILVLLVLYLISTQWHGLDMAYGFIGATVLMFIPGIGIGTKKHIQKVDMGILVFVASCMGIGVAGGAVGIGPLISDMVLPLLQGQSPFVFVAGVWITGVLSNFVMTPLALMTILAGPFAQIAVDLNMTAYPIAYILNQCGDVLLFPYENTTILVCYSFGLIYMKDFIKVMSAKAILSLVYLLAVGVPYWMLLGLL